MEQIQIKNESDDDVKDDIYFLNTKAFLTHEESESQYDFYKRHNSTDETLKLINNESKSFGSLMEKIISEIFCLEKRVNEQQDGLFDNKKIEIKSSRYWVNSNYDCKWQHIEPNHDFDICIFALVKFDCINCWAISKNDLFKKEMIEQKIISKQGKQGYWVKKSAIEKFLQPIKNKIDLQEFINKL